MKFFKFIAIFLLCFFMGSCPTEDDEFKIRIGDYENQLAAWNNNNILDYQLRLIYEDFKYYYDKSKRAYINVKNGIPENSEPPEWLMDGDMSTVPEIFSFIKEEEKKLMDGRYSFYKPGYFYVSYNPDYHYPDEISYAYTRTSSNSEPDWIWRINMILLVENEQEIWNRQNMHDYKLSLYYYHNGLPEQAIIMVKNGIPESSNPPEWLTSKKKSTIPEFFSFIKEEEERLDNIETARKGYFKVIYDPVYHYPKYITTTTFKGSVLDEKNYRWEISLTPLGENETGI
jgi:hypothetical protein